MKILTALVGVLWWDYDVLQMLYIIDCGCIWWYTYFISATRSSYFTVAVSDCFPLPQRSRFTPVGGFDECKNRKKEVKMGIGWGREVINLPGNPKNQYHFTCGLENICFLNGPPEYLFVETCVAAAIVCHFLIVIWWTVIIKWNICCNDLQ